MTEKRPTIEEADRRLQEQTRDLSNQCAKAIREGKPLPHGVALVAVIAMDEVPVIDENGENLVLAPIIMSLIDSINPDRDDEQNEIPIRSIIAAAGMTAPFRENTAFWLAAMKKGVRETLKMIPPHKQPVLQRFIERHLVRSPSKPH